MSVGVWERGWFDVPANATPERITHAENQARRVFGAVLERQGFKVLRMTPAQPMDPTIPCTTPDQKRYQMWALVYRRPHLCHFDIPDNAVPEMLKLPYMRLNE